MTDLTPEREQEIRAYIDVWYSPLGMPSKGTSSVSFVTALAHELLAALDAERARAEQLEAEAKISGGQAAQEAGRITRLTQRAVIAERRVRDLEAVAEAAREWDAAELGYNDEAGRRRRRRAAAALRAALAVLEEPQ